MAWIESHQSLATHRKTMRLSRRLGISIPEAIGHLHCLWWWGLDNTPDGNLSNLDPLDIAMAGLWEGDADTFVAALIDAGFVDQVKDHLVIHDWWEFAGKLIEQRQKNAERMRKARAVNGNGALGDVMHARAGHVPSTCKPRAPATVPNPTEQYPTQPDPTLPVPSEGLHTPPGKDVEGSNGDERAIAVQEVVDLMGFSLPRDWQFLSSLYDLCSRHGLLLDVEARTCYDTHRASGTDDRPWSKLLKNWIERSARPLVLLNRSEPVPGETQDPVELEETGILPFDALRQELRDTWPGESYNEFISPLWARQPEHGSLTIVCPDEYVQQWLAGRYSRQMEDALHQAGYLDLTLTYAVASAS